MKYKLLNQAKYLVLFLFVTTILSYTPVLASSPAPSPSCQITGVIKSVTFKEAYDEACLKTSNGCPTDMPTSHPDEYFLTIDISAVSYVNGETKNATCEERYPVGSTQKISVFKTTVKAGDILSVNQEIEGIVHSSWGNIFNSYSLKIETPKITRQAVSGQIIGGGDTTPANIFDAPRNFVYQIKQNNGNTINVAFTTYPPSPTGDKERKKTRFSFYNNKITVGDYLKAYGSLNKATQTLTVKDEGDYIETSNKPKEILEKTKVSDKIIKDKYADEVIDISLQTDENTYIVTAKKAGKLFFFIPVNFNLQITTDSTTGEVRGIIKPWWVFLVKN
jgi:hypothetical protein